LALFLENYITLHYFYFIFSSEFIHHELKKSSILLKLAKCKLKKGFIILIESFLSLLRSGNHIANLD